MGEGYPIPAWLPKGFTSFVGRMLLHQHTQRASAEELLRHDWMQGPPEPLEEEWRPPSPSPDQRRADPGIEHYSSQRWARTVSTDLTSYEAE
eukprot:NODE_6689_length_494_cov_22.206742_g5901_i0.p2 GENE.NODE_6689_length_494_cov_22.206742_g5901_i0~~NODE_6689_length_494_cov_22.206742_g5901_i0.p2  ORF type:complete len:102 (-),score=28.89 NODE_6689_length_494_cov_22.206742_g5901_i0:189-464(-)